MPPHHELQSVAPWQLSHCTTSVLQDEIPIDTTLCARVRPRLEPFLPILSEERVGKQQRDLAGANAVLWVHPPQGSCAPAASG